jgi:hypothetical protein
MLMFLLMLIEYSLQAIVANKCCLSFMWTGTFVALSHVLCLAYCTLLSALCNITLHLHMHKRHTLHKQLLSASSNHCMSHKLCILHIALICILHIRCWLHRFAYCTFIASAHYNNFCFAHIAFCTLHQLLLVAKPMHITHCTVNLAYCIQHICT